MLNFSGSIPKQKLIIREESKKGKLQQKLRKMKEIGRARRSSYTLGIQDPKHLIIHVNPRSKSQPMPLHNSVLPWTTKQLPSTNQNNSA